MVKNVYDTPVWRTVWFAVVVCGVLLALSLIPSVSAFIAYVDQHAAYWFNSRAGQLPVLDRFVLLLAEEEGRERIVLLSVLWFLAAVWMAPTRLEKSRLLGTLLFMIAVLLLYFLLDSLMDDVVERKSPSAEFLNPFIDIGKILDYDVDLTDRRSYPNFDGMLLCTMGFILLRLRNYVGAGIALVLGLTVPLLVCIAGLCWVSDIYLGSLPIAFLVSAVAVETPFFRLYWYLVDLAAAGFDQRDRLVRSLGPMWRHRKLYWTSRNVHHMEVAVKRFAAQNLPKILDSDGKHRDETPRLEVPLGGLRSVVRIVTLGPKQVVLRAYPINKRFEAAQHRRASDLLMSHGVRVPEIYYHEENPGKHGAVFIVEEFVEGRSKQPNELTEADIKAVAAELATLHKVTSAVWGPVKSPRTEHFAKVLERRMERRLGHGSRGGTVRRSKEDLNKVRKWLGQWRDKLAEVDQFNLVHGKLHRENCLFEPGGGFCLLDITTLEWGMATSDLVLVHHSQCGGDAALIEKLNEAYFAEFPPELADRIRRFIPMYEAMYCISQLSKNRKRFARTSRKKAGSFQDKGEKWWSRLMGIVNDPRFAPENS